jgi:hypothetical protein
MSGQSSTTQNKNTTSQTGPWAPAQGQLQNIALPDLQNALAQSQAGNAATTPSGFVAGLTPDQIANFQQMIGAGQNTGAANNEINTGQSLLGSGSAGANSALAQLLGYNPSATNNTQSQIDAANQYVQGQNIPAQVANAMQQANETARDVTLPGIESAAAGTGNTNSSRTGIAEGLVQRGLAEQTANLSGTLQSQAFANGLNLANNTANANNTLGLSGINSAGNLGSTLLGQGVGATGSGVNDLTSILGLGAAGGAGLQQGNQLGLDEQLAQNQYATQNPYASLAPYLAGLTGIAGLGSTGQSDTTDTTTSNPSFLSTLGGILGAGGSLLGGTSASGATTGLGGIQGILSLLNRK